MGETGTSWDGPCWLLMCIDDGGENGGEDGGEIRKRSQGGLVVWVDGRYCSWSSMNP